MPKDAQGNDIPEPKTQPEAKPGDSVPIARLNEVIGERNTLRETLDKQGKALADLQAKIKETEDKGLAEQGKFKDLYDKEKAEREKLLPVADQLKAYNDKLTALNAERRKAIPEEYHDIIPQSFPTPIDEYDYLEKFIGKLPALKSPGSPPTAPRGGTGGAPTDRMREIDLELEKLNGKYGDDAALARIKLKEERQSLSMAQRPESKDKLPHH